MNAPEHIDDLDIVTPAQYAAYGDHERRTEQATRLEIRETPHGDLLEYTATVKRFLYVNADTGRRFGELIKRGVADGAEFVEYGELSHRGKNGDR